MRKYRVAGLMLLALITLATSARFSAQQQGRAAPPNNELATTVRDGFTIASVGDLILAYPQSQNPDPSFRSVVKLLQDADVATGNYEGNIIDGRFFKGSGPGGFAGVPEVAADLKALGVDLVARSNNHAGEYGYEGMMETNSWLDKGGVVYAGAGEKYWSARAARFVSTPGGRVGMVATAGSFPEAFMAQPGRGEWPGRGGASALRTTRYFMSPPALFQAAKAVRQGFPNGTGFYARGADSDTEVSILGQTFRLDPKATKPYYSFQMNEQDLKDILASVREGKMRSDFMTVAIHAHHFHDATGGERGVGVPETVDIDTNPSIADYLPVFAKATIDNGADAFLGTGVHVLRGIEIYKGRPIFYGLGEFFRQMDVVGISGMGLGRGDENSPPIKYESIVAVSRFERGQLSEVRLHPVQLTEDTRMAHRGLPRVASPEAAQRILTRLQKLSAPLGTKITIENNIGVIRVQPGATTSSGAQ